LDAYFWTLTKENLQYVKKKCGVDRGVLPSSHCNECYQHLVHTLPPPSLKHPRLKSGC